jgi:hypothetical protein
MIQAVVNRLAQNSFQAKSWSVAVVTVILAFTGRTAQPPACALALFPAFCFWVLDAYYLRQERLFRALYRGAIAGEVSAFTLDTSPYETHLPSWGATMFAIPVLLVHAIILVLIALVIIVFALA